VNLDSNAGESDLLGFGSDAEEEEKKNSSMKNEDVLDDIFTSGNGGDNNIFDFKSDSKDKVDSESYIPVIAPSRRDSTSRSHRTRSSIGSKTDDILSFNEDLDISSISKSNKANESLNQANDLANSMNGMKIKLKPPPSGSDHKSQSNSTNKNTTASIPILPPPRESPKSPLKTSANFNLQSSTNDTFDFFGGNDNSNVKQEENTKNNITLSDQQRSTSFSDTPSTSPFDASNANVIPVSDHESTMLESMNASKKNDQNRSNLVAGNNRSSATIPSLPPPPSSSSKNQFMASGTFNSLLEPQTQTSQDWTGSSGFLSTNQTNNSFPISSVNDMKATDRPSFDSFNAFSSSNINSQSIPNTLDPFNTNNSIQFPSGNSSNNQIDPFNTSTWQHSNQHQGNTNVNSNSKKESSNPFDMF